jgi:hypothetical protein
MLYVDRKLWLPDDFLALSDKKERGPLLDNKGIPPSDFRMVPQTVVLVLT